MKAKAMIIVSLLFTLTAGAQTVNVHKTDGTILTINANEFDYIDFSAAGEPRPGTGHTPEGAVAVDLGLPSGTKWANMNVGAEKPEDYGLYFAWGETVGHTGDISDGRLFDWASYKWCNGSEDSLVKYAIVNNKIVLDLEDDAAYVNWGSDWRMPTLTEIKELLDNTTFERIIQNGVNGCK